MRDPTARARILHHHGLGKSEGGSGWVSHLSLQRGSDALCCGALQSIAPCSSVLRCIAKCCVVLHCIALQSTASLGQTQLRLAAVTKLACPPLTGASTAASDKS